MATLIEILDSFAYVILPYVYLHFYHCFYICHFLHFVLVCICDFFNMCIFLLICMGDIFCDLDMEVILLSEDQLELQWHAIFKKKTVNTSSRLEGRDIQ